MKNKTVAISDEAVDNLTALIDYFNEFNTPIQKNNGVTIKMNFEVFEKLLTEVYGLHQEYILWFLYDWKEGYEIEIDGKKYIINNLDDYLAYVKGVYYSE